MCHSTKLSPSIFYPNYLRYDTMSGQTPTMLASTSVRDSIPSSIVKIARWRLNRDIIQSRCSAAFKQITINLFVEKWLKLPNTDDATFENSSTATAIQRLCSQRVFLCTRHPCIPHMSTRD